MATSYRKRGNIWQARITWRANGRQKEKVVSLDTSRDSVADIRMIDINRNEKAIRRLKEGEKISFPWENDSGKVELIIYNLGSAKIDWEQSLILNRMASGSIKIYLSAIDMLIKVCGEKCHVNDVKFQHIEKLKGEMSHLADATINMRLRAINTFFIWLCDNEKVIKPPKIKKIPIKRKKPSYYSIAEFDLVQSYVDAELFRRMYRCYRGTGLRLFEPFNATITSTGLIIPSGRTKNSYERTMELNEEQMSTIKDIRAWVKGKVVSNKATQKWAVRHIWRVWNTACKNAGLKKRKLHNLRHTFAVMEWLRTGDIYLVSKKLGHSTVTTTEIYTKFDEPELKKDFPVDACRLNGNGQVLMGSKTSAYNYGKA